MTIKVFVTGGTIDDLDYDDASKTPKGQKSMIKDMLLKSRISTDYNVEVICFKDSRFIDEKDRQKLLKKCKVCPEEKILITHGSITMPMTAKFLGEQKLQKTIILTGAAIPGNKRDSDAPFNLGFAFSSAQLLPIGIYIVMNGKIFLWDNVKKDLETGFFETER